MNSLDRGRYRDADGRGKSVVPVRFVMACKKAHISDIEWAEFVHGTKGCTRDLWIEERGTSGDLDEIFIVCECGQERAMSQAARLELKALGHCRGSRPWLGPGNREGCGEPNRLLIRSASNAYFPQLMSVISIPETQSPVDDVVRALWEDFLADVESAADLDKVRKKPTPAAKLEGLDVEAVLASINRVRGGASGRATHGASAVADISTHRGPLRWRSSCARVQLPETQIGPWLIVPLTECKIALTDAELGFGSCIGAGMLRLAQSSGEETISGCALST